MAEIIANEKNLTEDMLAGFAAYSSAHELGDDENAAAPATSPLTVTTVSSPECVAFTIGLTSGGVTTTLAAGC